VVGPFILLLTTLIWGTAFLTQKFAAASLGPFAILFSRSILGGVFLLLCLFARAYCRAGGPVSSVRVSLKAGVLCGIPLFAAMLAQQIGIETTSPGICAFLTTNYVLFVPLGAALIIRRGPPRYVWFGVALAIVGTFLLSVRASDLSRGALAFGSGELWTILCAILFSVQMLLVDHFAARCDLIVMSIVQLFTVAILALPFLALPTEVAFWAHATFDRTAILSIVYLGVFSSGIAYTLQNFGQARTSPSVAAIILSLESVFGALSGWIALGDTMTPLQLSGCALVLLAAVLTQLLHVCK